MGVKRNVWTSGIQPLIPKLKTTLFSIRNFENTQTHFFPIMCFWIPLHFLIKLEKNVLDPKLVHFHWSLSKEILASLPQIH